MEIWPGRSYPLGATWDGRGVNFAVFSEHARGVDLCLFDSAMGRRESHRIALSHRNVMSFVDWAAQIFAVSSADQVTSHAPLHFDLSTFDIFCTLSRHGTLHLIDDLTAKFAGAVRGEEPLVVTPEDALASVQVIEGAYRSLARGSWEPIREIEREVALA